MKTNVGFNVVFGLSLIAGACGDPPPPEPPPCISCEDILGEDGLTCACVVDGISLGGGSFCIASGTGPDSNFAIAGNACADMGGEWVCEDRYACPDESESTSGSATSDAPAATGEPTEPTSSAAATDSLPTSAGTTMDCNTGGDSDATISCSASEEGSSDTTATDTDVSTGDESGGLSVACEDWVPEEKVVLLSGIYYYDWSFIDGLTENPLPLMVCDDALFQAVAPNGFQVISASPGELLYELGLRSGDIPLEVNGMPIETYEDVWEAYIQLWLEEEAGWLFDVYLLRGTNYMTLSYEPIIASP